MFPWFILVKSCVKNAEDITNVTSLCDCQNQVRIMLDMSLFKRKIKAQYLVWSIGGILHAFSKSNTREKPKNEMNPPLFQKFLILMTHLRYRRSFKT